MSRTGIYHVMLRGINRQSLFEEPDDRWGGWNQKPVPAILLLYDEAHHAVAAIHAGWRGTVKRIAQKTVETMIQTYGTRPADVRAVIGPGISLEAFEVGDEV